MAFAIGAVVDSAVTDDNSILLGGLKASPTGEVY